MILNRISSQRLLARKLIMQFSGSHHHVYDWRDDHVANPDYEENVRMIGVKDSSTYSFPHKS